MSVAVNTSNSNSVKGTAVSSLNWSQVVAAGDDLLVVTAGSGNSGAANISSITFGAANVNGAMWDRRDGTNAWNETHARYLKAPSPGTATVTVTYSVTCSQAAAGGTCFSGVDQTTPIGTASTTNQDDTGTTTTPNLTIASQTGEIVVAHIHSDDDVNLTESGGATRQWLQTGIASDTSGCCATKPGAASTNIQFTQGGPPPGHAMGATAILQALASNVLAAIGWRNQQNPRLRGAIKQSRFKRTQLWSTGSALTAGPLSGNGTFTFTTVGTLTAAGALSGKSAMTVQSTGAPSAKGALTGASSATIQTRGTATGSGALTGQSVATIQTRGTATGAGALNGRAIATIQTQATPSAKGALSGRSAFTISTNGSLTALTLGSMIGRSVFTISTRATPSAKGDLSGSSALNIATRATPSAKGALTGQAIGTVQSVGFLRGLVSISGKSQFNFVLRGLMTGLTPSAPSWLELPLSNVYRRNAYQNIYRGNKIEGELRQNKITTEGAE
jgi:hypothetical protein